MKLQYLAPLVHKGCPIRRPHPHRGFVALKSVAHFLEKCSPDDCLAEDWEPWPRNEKERQILASLDIQTGGPVEGQ